MKTILNKSVISNLIVYLFILLFVYTAASKLMTMETFQVVLAKYPLIGGYSAIIAYLVPISELLVSVLLIIPVTKKYGIVASIALMALFLSYIIYMLISNSALPCSCGGLISQLSWQQHIWFNSVLLLLGIVALKIGKAP